MPGEHNFTKVLCLIDVWEKLNHPIEIQIKDNICKFLTKIQNNTDWKIYFYSGDISPDYNVLQCLNGTNYEITGNTLEVFKPRHHVKDYYFAGFHTNLCLFASEIGIEKYLQCNNQCNFKILEDLTAALDLKDNCITINDLTHVNAGSCTESEEHIIIQNYRQHIISKNRTQSNLVVKG